MKNILRVAIVYDWMDKWGGVERVLLTFQEMFPTAVFYTSYHDKQKTPWSQNFIVKTSFIHRLPSFIKQSRVLSLPLYPYAFESFNFNEYDLVISVTSSFAKGVITRPETKHICYLLTPTRFLWGQSQDYSTTPLLSMGQAFYGSKMRKWDLVAATRPDSIISISKTTQQRCKKYYRRSSEVIHPPFDEEYWKRMQVETENGPQVSTPFSKYYLAVSRLESYKKIDLLIETFNKIKDKNLIIVGTGTDEERLHTQAASNTQFKKNVTDRELAQLYTHAEALIMPQEEDFGYVSLEAQALGCPVITYKKGGGAETVLEGKTGVFIDSQTEAGIIDALERFGKISYNLKQTVKTVGKTHLQQFSKERFIRSFMSTINHSLQI